MDLLFRDLFLDDTGDTGQPSLGTESLSEALYRHERSRETVDRSASYTALKRHRCSRVPVHELQPACVRSLELQQVNWGKCLLAQVAAVPYRTVALHTVVVDQTGGPARLSLYRSSTQARASPDVSAELPVGTVVVIKEPYCKVSQ